MVNNSVPPTSSSSIPLHTLSSSSVSNSEQQSHPSNNNGERHHSRKNINIHTKTYIRNLNQRPRNLLKAHITSQQRPYFSEHHTMGGGAIVVDLLSAFGLLHNISVHEPSVVLRPGAHSAAPAALFSSSTVVSGSAIRHVRLDLNNLKYKQYNAGASRSSSSIPLPNEVTRCTL